MGHFDHLVWAWRRFCRVWNGFNRDGTQEITRACNSFEPANKYTMDSEYDDYVDKNDTPTLIIYGCMHHPDDGGSAHLQGSLQEILSRANNRPPCVRVAGAYPRSASRVHRTPGEKMFPG